MLTCENCGSTNFDSEEGFYFCLDCNIQSQQIRDFEEGEEFKEISRVVLKSQIKEVKGPKAGKQKVERSAGRPWRIQDGLNIVIREQVRALIKLGASPKLKEVVLQLWAFYLSKTKSAFTGKKEGEEFLPKLSVWPRMRDVQMSTSDDPVIKAISKKGNLNKKEINIETNDENNMEIEEGLDPHQNEDSEKSIKRPSKSTLFRSVERTRLIHTICFCYLALAYLSSKILLSDLLRWIAEGTIPYMNAALFIPNDMKFCKSDYSTFCPMVIPRPAHVRLETGHLIRFMKLKNFPHVELESISHRFILDLNLPGDMHSLVVKLIGVRPPICSWDIKNTFVMPPSLEMRAMAFIILTLKYLFGLDDKIEKLHSQTAIEVNKFLDTGKKIFVWSHWVKYLQLRQHLMKTYAANPNSLSHPVGTVNLKSIVTYDQTVAKKWGTRYSSASFPASDYWKRVKKVFIQPFKLLVENEIDGFEKMEQQPTSFPGLRFVQNIFSKKNSNFQHDISSVDIKILQRNFRQKSLKMLIDPYTFIAEMEEQNIIILIGGSKQKNKNHKNKNMKKLFKRTKLTQKVKTSKTHNISVDSSQDSNAIHLFLPKSRTAVLSNNTKISKSLSWLINICSEYLEYPFEDLLKDVAFVETALLKTVGVYSKQVYWINY